MDSSATDDRLVQLETRIAYQDHLLANLDEVVREFSHRVQQLERELQSLRESVNSSGETGPANDPPPHY